MFDKAKFPKRMSIILERFLFGETPGNNGFDECDLNGDCPSDIVRNVGDSQMEYGAASHWSFGYDGRACKPNSDLCRWGHMTVHMLPDIQQHEIRNILIEVTAILEADAFDKPWEAYTEGREIKDRFNNVWGWFWVNPTEGYTPDGWYDFGTISDRDNVEFKSPDGVILKSVDFVDDWKEYRFHWVLEDGTKLYRNFPEDGGKDWKVRRVK